MERPNQHNKKKTIHRAGKDVDEKQTVCGSLLDELTAGRRATRGRLRLICKDWPDDFGALIWLPASQHVGHRVGWNVVNIAAMAGVDLLTAEAGELDDAHKVVFAFGQLDEWRIFPTHRVAVVHHDEDLARPDGGQKLLLALVVRHGQLGHIELVEALFLKKIVGAHNDGLNHFAIECIAQRLCVRALAGARNTPDNHHFSDCRAGVAPGNGLDGANALRRLLIGTVEVDGPQGLTSMRLRLLDGPECRRW